MTLRAPDKRSRWVPPVVVAFTLLVLAGTVYLGARHLRAQIHEQLTNRDGQVLYTVALAQQFRVVTGAGLDTRLQNPAAQLELALNISQLKDDVMAVRLFDSAGKFILSVPPNIRDENLSAAELATLARFEPQSFFLPHAALEELLLDMPATQGPRVPLLKVNLPIHPRGRQELLGCAQLILDARSLEAEFAATDANLLRQSVAVFLGSGAVLLIVLWWAYRTLRRTHRMLADRTACLLRANHELALSAKTKALGAVTAHLIHGLSNPLAHLQDFVTSRQGSQPGDADWQGAVASARRMQQLVDEAVRVLAEQNGGGDNYELNLAELADIAAARIKPVAVAAGVEFRVENRGQATLSNTEANLALLILDNLLHNAIKATPHGKYVCLTLASNAERIACEVSDQGSGIPDDIRARLFTPCHSHTGGSGIGLAISRQLAGQLGGSLELVETGPSGTRFLLTFTPRQHTPQKDIPETELAPDHASRN